MHRSVDRRGGRLRPGRDGRPGRRSGLNLQPQRVALPADADHGQRPGARAPTGSTQAPKRVTLLVQREWTQEESRGITRSFLQILDSTEQAIDDTGVENLSRRQVTELLMHFSQHRDALWLMASTGQPATDRWATERQRAIDILQHALLPGLNRHLHHGKGLDPVCLSVVAAALNAFLKTRFLAVDEPVVVALGQLFLSTCTPSPALTSDAHAVGAQLSAMCNGLRAALFNSTAPGVVLAINGLASQLTPALMKWADTLTCATAMNSLQFLQGLPTWATHAGLLAAIRCMVTRLAAKDMRNAKLRTSGTSLGSMATLVQRGALAADHPDLLAAILHGLEAVEQELRAPLTTSINLSQVTRAVPMLMAHGALPADTPGLERQWSAMMGAVLQLQRAPLESVRQFIKHTNQASDRPPLHLNRALLAQTLQHLLVLVQRQGDEVVEWSDLGEAIYSLGRACKGYLLAANDPELGRALQVMLTQARDPRTPGLNQLATVQALGGIRHLIEERVIINASPDLIAALRLLLGQMRPDWPPTWSDHHLPLVLQALGGLHRFRGKLPPELAVTADVTRLALQLQTHLEHQPLPGEHLPPGLPVSSRPPLTWCVTALAALRDLDELGLLKLNTPQSRGMRAQLAVLADNACQDGASVKDLARLVNDLKFTTTTDPANWITNILRPLLVRVMPMLAHQLPNTNGHNLALVLNALDMVAPLHISDQESVSPTRLVTLLLPSINPDCLRRTVTRHRAMLLNALTNCLRLQLVQRSDAALQQAFLALCDSMRREWLTQVPVQSVSLSLNAIQVALQAGVLQADNPRVRAAANDLVACVQMEWLADADWQACSIFMKAITSHLNDGLITGVTVRPPLRAVMTRFVSLPGGAALQPHIATCLRTLQQLITWRVLSAHEREVRSALVFLAGLIDSQALSRASADDVNGMMAGLRVGVQSGAIRSDAPTVERAFQALLRRNQGDAQANELGLAFNSLRNAVDLGRGRPSRMDYRSYYAALLAQVTPAALAHIDAFGLGLMLASVRFAVSERVVQPMDNRVMPALQRMFNVVPTLSFEGCTTQSLQLMIQAAGSLSQFTLGLPGVVCTPAAAMVLVRAVAQHDYRGADERMHALVSTLRALRQLVNNRVVDPDDPALTAAAQRLLRAMAMNREPWLRRITVAEGLLGLKCALQNGWIEAADPLCVQACAQLVRALGLPQMAGLEERQTAMVLSGLKGVLEAHAIGHRTAGIHMAVQNLLSCIDLIEIQQLRAERLGLMLNGLVALLDHHLVLGSDPTLRSVTQRLLARIATRPVSTLGGDTLARYLHGLVGLNRNGVLDRDESVAFARVLLPWVDPVLLNTTSSESLGVGGRNLCALVTLRLLPLADAWPAINGCLLALGRQQATPFERSLATKLALRGLDELHLQLRSARREAASQPDLARALSAIDVRPALRALMVWAQPDQWVVDRRQHEDMAVHAVQALTSLTHLMLFYKRPKPGLVLPEPSVRELIETCAARIGAQLATLLQSRQSAGRSLRAQEMEMVARYAPRVNVTPKYQAMGADQQQALMKTTWTQLQGPCRPMVSDPPHVLTVQKIWRRARDAEPDTAARYDCSIYREVFPHPTLPPYVLMPLDAYMHPAQTPVFRRVGAQWYRMDSIGGSRLKTRRREQTHGTLIGVPIEASDFFAQQWFTSEESYCYGQRAFMPQDPMPDDDQPPRPTPALQGTIEVALVPDQTPVTFAPNSDQGPMRSGDGFGFLHEDLARAMGLMASTAPPLRGQITCPGNLSYQAMQAYPVPADAKGRDALRSQALQRAQPKLQALLEHWSPQTLQGPEYGDNALYYIFTHGKPSGFAPTAVPVTGHQLVLPANAAWTQVAHQGVLLGRNPYDTTNLLTLKPENIVYSKALDGRIAYQYSITGYTAGEHGNFVSHFCKGLFVVVPAAQWPGKYNKARVILSAKDRKMCSLWHSLADKNHGQSTEAQLSLHGCLVVKEQRNDIVGVPPELMDRLAGDFDGDQVDVVPLGEWPALAELVAQTPKRDNPKLPKKFTPRTSPGNIGKIIDLRQDLLQDWVTICGLYSAAPPDQRNALTNALAADSSLDEVLGEHWLDDLFPGLPPAPHADSDGDLNISGARIASLTDAQRAQVVALEIAIGIKAGTDAEKTTVPITPLKLRAIAAKGVLSGFGLGPLPYSGGFRDRLAQAIGDPDGRGTVLTLLERAELRGRGLHSIPNDSMQAILGWFLDAAAQRGLFAGDTIDTACRALTVLGATTDPRQVERRATGIAQGLGHMVATTALTSATLPSLVGMLQALGARLIEAPVQAPLRALAGLLSRHKPGADDDVLDTDRMQRLLAEGIAACTDTLLVGPTPPGLRELWSAVRSWPDCTGLLPAAGAAASDWRKALMAMCAHRIHAPEGAWKSTQVELADASETLALALCNLMRMAGTKGSVTLRVRPGLEAALTDKTNAMNKDPANAQGPTFTLEVVEEDEDAAAIE